MASRRQHQHQSSASSSMFSVPFTRIALTFLAVSSSISTISAGKPSGKGFKQALYAPGGEIPVTCLNRTVDRGEHIEIDGVFQFIPFLTCAETKKPLAFKYLSEETLNCTIESVDDDTYHLWEFYVHNDSPLTCRVPARPATGDRAIDVEPGADSKEWIPFVINLAGKFEKSHIHVSSILNVIFHTIEPQNEDDAPGVIDSATAYSISPLTSSTRVVISDPLPLQFSIRWYSGPSLPLSDSADNDWGKNRADGSHVTVHTLIYCLLTAGCTAVACTAWFIGWDFPRRLRRVRAGGALGGFSALGVNMNGGGSNGISVGPGKPGGYGILPGDHDASGGANGWYTKKD